MNSNRKYTPIDLKIVVLGAASVGKTSIINRYCNGVFQEETLSTIGAGFFTHTVTVNDNEVTLMVWDTAGEERFRSVAPSLLRGASGLVLVYDLQSQESFGNLDTYMEMFLDTVNVNPGAQMPVLLLGNKKDLPNPTVTPDMIESWKNKNHVTLSGLVSAKTGENIEDSFISLVEVLVSPGNYQDSPPLSFPTPVEKPDKQGGCC